MTHGVALSLTSFLVLGLWLTACDAGDASDGPLIASTQPGDDATPEALIEDSDTESVDVDDHALPQPSRSSYQLLVTGLRFPFEGPEGIVPGFDLDGAVSDPSQPHPCGWDDFTSPYGTPGIDNQAAILSPLFDAVGFGQAHQYLQTSIEASGFFILFDLSGVDDLENDPEIDVVYEVGGGSGVMDSAGTLVPYQTMCVQDDSPSVVATEAYIEDGVLHAKFDAIVLLISMFERVYPFTIAETHLMGNISGEGFITDGVVGGRLSIEELLNLISKMGQNQGGLTETMQPIIAGLGDLPSESGECGGMSGALVFDTVPAFFYPEDSECDPCGNGTCDVFESCETCQLDCCSGCGDGVCHRYESITEEVSITEVGFEPDTLSLTVSDKVRWTNNTGAAVNLACDGGMLSVERIEAGESKKLIMQASGDYACSTYEQIGRVNALAVVDNQTEDCQACPQDCGICD